MTKRALVISGGGSKGAFAVGVLQHLIGTLDLKFDLVAGTSTGALISPLAVTRDLDAMVRIYSSVRTGDIIRRRPLHRIVRSSSVFDTRPLQRLIGRELDADRARAVFASPTQMIIAAVCLQDRRTTYFYTGTRGRPGQGGRAERIRDLDTMRRAVLASSDQPVLMPPVRIPGRRTPIRQYVDGGVKEYAPLSAAIENGATEIYVIALSPEREPAQGKRYTNVLDIAGRTLDILVDDVGQNDLASGRFYADATCYVDAVKRRARTELGLSAAQVRRLFDVPGHANPFAGRPAVRLHVVRPTRGLPTDGLDFDPDVMQRMMRSGMARARAVLGR